MSTETLEKSEQEVAEVKSLKRHFLVKREKNFSPIPLTRIILLLFKYWVYAQH